MKDKYFVKYSHLDLWLVFPLVYVVAICIISLVCFSDEINPFPIGILTVYGVLLVLIVITSLYDKQKGLYINGHEIYFKKIRKQHIEYSKIKGIKIIKSYGYQRYRGYYPLKEKGEQLFSATLVKELEPEMIIFDRGDLWFNRKFRDRIICTFVYDEKVIDDLKHQNSDIYIMDGRNII